MYSKGYSQKQLELVFNTSKSTVHRIVKDKTWKHVNFKDYDEETNDSKYLSNKFVLDKILKLNEIPGIGNLDKMDMTYIALLKTCHVPYAKVRQIYNDIPVKKLRSAYDYPKQKPKNFNSQLIGLKQEDYNKFLGL